MRRLPFHFHPPHARSRRPRLQLARRSRAVGPQASSGGALHRATHRRADAPAVRHRRDLSRFALVVTALLGVAYAYLAARLATGAGSAAALATPFVLIWILPVVYWGSERGREGFIDKLLHRASYLSMAWVSFALVLTLFRDILLVATFPFPELHARASA